MSQAPHRETVWIQADDGLMLSIRRWRTANRPVLICPGRAEAAIKYDDFALELVNHGLSPWIVDWRG
ncbi:MAG TPA: alpha/beta hydrolase, partial [Myxococcales bacterium]|nr:alpha/beta hydrolase [Myxococcales bacterium]